METKQLGFMLSQRRRALGLSQDDVAFAIGTNRRVIGELERGKDTVQVGIVLRAAASLGLDVDLTERT